MENGNKINQFIIKYFIGMLKSSFAIDNTCHLFMIDCISSVHN